MATLDRLPARRPARIVAVHWDALAPEEAKRLQTLGIVEGARVSVAYRGIFAGRDPLAVAVGRMIVALRRSHARAIEVEELAGARAPEAPAPDAAAPEDSPAPERSAALPATMVRGA
ncbi:MAG: ferrous iron transport protein A [Porphyrobacter sp.]|nr:ferrous iron transport protein A [Porphyrobacter sp.]